MPSLVADRDVLIQARKPSPLDLWAAAAIVDAIKARQRTTKGARKAAFVIAMAQPRTLLSRQTDDWLVPDRYLAAVGIELGWIWQRVRHSCVDATGTPGCHGCIENVIWAGRPRLLQMVWDHYTGLRQ